MNKVLCYVISRGGEREISDQQQRQSLSAPHPKIGRRGQRTWRTCMAANDPVQVKHCSRLGRHRPALASLRSARATGYSRDDDTVPALLSTEHWALSTEVDCRVVVTDLNTGKRYCLSLVRRPVVPGYPTAEIDGCIGSWSVIEKGDTFPAWSPSALLFFFLCVLLLFFCRARLLSSLAWFGNVTRHESFLGLCFHLCFDCESMYILTWLIRKEPFKFTEDFASLSFFLSFFFLSSSSSPSSSVLFHLP